MASPGNPNQQQGRGISPLPSLFLALNLHITKSHYVHLFLFSGEKCSREPGNLTECMSTNILPFMFSVLAYHWMRS
jgi:hypothetical protein